MFADYVQCSALLAYSLENSNAGPWRLLITQCSNVASKYLT